MNWQRTRCLLIKELIQLSRDKRLFGILLAAPVIQLMVLGYAATTDIRNIALSVRDYDHSFHSRDYIRTLAASGYFTVTPLTGPDRDDGHRLVFGQAGLIVVIPQEFSRKLNAGESAPVQVLVDGADSNFGVLGLAYLQKATRLYSQRLVNLIAADLARQQARSLPAVTAETRVWYNPDLTSTLYMVPAVMGILLMVTTMIVTSMALVKEREEGTMEQLIVTPLQASELIAGKLLPFVAVGLIEISLALPVMRLIFAIPLRGSLLLFYGFSGIFLLSTLGLGLLVSLLVRTQQQAMLLATFFVLMPFVLLSGFIFPTENMPDALRWITHLIPLKYYLQMVRGIFLKGAGWAELWPQALILLALGLAILGLAINRFHKRLD